MNNFSDMLTSFSVPKTLCKARFAMRRSSSAEVSSRSASESLYLT